MRTAGIHHITAIAGDPQRNIDFYAGLLGLRLVKKTVNFDDPGSYHFYFGDYLGTPGTVITFFPWPGARRGARGSGQVIAASFAVLTDSLPIWEQRLRDEHLPVETADDRFGQPVLRFLDSDGLMLELIGLVDDPPPSTTPAVDVAPGQSREVRLSDEHSSHKIIAFAPPTLQVSRPDETEQLLTDILGFERVGRDGDRRRFRASANSAGCVDLLASGAAFGRVAAGTVHHIAFRASNDDEQLRWRDQLIENGYQVSPVMDRQYFHSIYFREPSGILFEIATDGPGFAIDERAENLGETLKLPPMFEAERSEIERVLPPVRSPAVVLG